MKTIPTKNEYWMKLLPPHVLARVIIEIDEANHEQDEEIYDVVLEGQSVLILTCGQDLAHDLLTKAFLDRNRQVV